MSLPGFVVRIPEVKHWVYVFLGDFISDVLFVGLNQVIDVIEHGNCDWLNKLEAFLHCAVYWIQRFDDKTVVTKHELLQDGMKKKC